MPTRPTGGRAVEASMPASARKSRHAMKVFYFDGTGLCVFYKRLDAGTFRMPLSHDGTSPTIVLSERQLS
ncbi:MAG: IS66 family insertion sequence element accessory protein TnpB, partial [Deltaproteobacteria bacterium]